MIRLFHICLVLFCTPSLAAIDVTKLPHVIDDFYQNQTGEMSTFIEDKTTPVLEFGQEASRATAFLLHQSDAKSPQSIVYTCNPSLKGFTKGTHVMIDVNGGAERDNFEGAPNRSIWHGSIAGDGCALAEVSLSAALFRVIDDKVIYVNTIVYGDNSEPSIISNAYYIGSKEMDDKYDLPFKIFINNVSQILKFIEGK
ncbi:hypothetical protein OPW41_16045 [Vibrio europaeus]|uniref:Uncharacterized protein n=1 Tax=Vibrio europaeus TaxID=300876 RepID=A0A178JDJ0_9VIBR|nr:hypothetical protein [Vibrio europaeus]MDC5703798.1 hypothetical protein [Vibrio europaeus]MDC5708248.1 hypothetical protein [Vibrio europaeus]MDC5714345.1 hypothetical protein [Vibrio europaeus]MDC5722546.1 hypothetical protein [Vibrio europaeus]MDC5727173.1 hypothetical protein [Vibrio europaeus]